MKKMMNKRLWALVFALGTCASLSAQDLIVKTDATQVEARVLEITPEQIRYKRFSNPDGPTYVLPVSAIDYIRYANGDTDTFRQPADPANAPQTLPANPPFLVMPVPADTTQRAQAADPANAPQTLPANPPFLVMPVPTDTAQQAQAADPANVPQTLPANPPYPVAIIPQPGGGYVMARQYDIGDFYDENGVRGIVCQVNEDRTHGLVLSLDEIYLRWSVYDKSDLRTVGADNMDDGRVNMEKVAAYIAANGASWEDFPAFKWCLDQGEGWYLPAVNEILSIGNNFNGGTRAKWNREARNRFNDNLKAHGGKRMDRLVYYYSSTERDEKGAYTSHMDIEPPFVVEIPKYTKFLVRAVHRF